MRRLLFKAHGSWIRISISVDRGFSEDVHLQQVLETVSAAAPALGNIPEDVDNRGKDIAVAVGQQGWGLDVVHFGDLVVQFDEAGGWLATGNGDEAFFDDGAVVGLTGESV